MTDLMTDFLIAPEDEAYPHPKRWTLQECEKLVELGFIPQRSQLVNGIICLTTAPTPPQVYTMQMLSGWFYGLYDSMSVFQRAYFAIPGELGKYNVLEPNVGVTREPFTVYYPNHPGPADMRMVAEVSASTPTFNLNTKATAYARVGIPEYWVFDIMRRQVHCHRSPSPDGYRKIVVLNENDILTAPGREEAIQISELLPPAANS